MALPGVTCYLLPSDMREVQAQWASSGSVSHYDFGSGIVTTPAQFPLELSGSDIEIRPDALAFDYNISFAYGPSETGSTLAGFINKAWRLSHVYNDPAANSGTFYLARENDAGTDWRTDLPLFTYTGSEAVEIDLVFDQAGRPVVAAERLLIDGYATESFVWLYRYEAAVGDFTLRRITTGSNPRVILDDPVQPEISDVLLFYRRGITSEVKVSASAHMISATGSGTDDVYSSSYMNGNIDLTMIPYKYVADDPTYPGIFTSARPTEPVAITGTFSEPVRQVGAVIVGAESSQSYLNAYDITGTLVACGSFVPNLTPDGADYYTTLVETKDLLIVKPDTEDITIKYFHLIPGPWPEERQSMGYDTVLFLPVSGTENGDNVTPYAYNYLYTRRQGDDYELEVPVPLGDTQFFESHYVFTGSVTGSVGTGQAAEISGVFHDSSYMSGSITLIDAYSGTLYTSGSNSEFIGWATASVDGFASGTFTGSFRVADYAWNAIVTGTAYREYTAQTPYIYELFLEDALKLRDNRVSLYVSRRNMDSSSVDLGEYQLSKIDSLIYPLWIEELELSHSVAFITGTLNPILDVIMHVTESIMPSILIPSGTHILRDAVITHSIYTTESIMPSILIPSGTHVMYDTLITHTVYDKDGFTSHSVTMGSDESVLNRDMFLKYYSYYKDSFASWSYGITTGSLE